MTNIEMDACRALIGINKSLATICELMKKNNTAFIEKACRAFCKGCTNTCKGDPECEILNDLLEQLNS